MSIQLLDDLGLRDLPAEAKQSLLQCLYRELELNVGAALSDGLDPEQMAELERIIAGDDATIEDVLQRFEFRIDGPVEGDRRSDVASGLWLSAAKPDYKDVVNRQFEYICEEVRVSAERIVAQIGRSEARGKG